MNHLPMPCRTSSHNDPPLDLSASQGTNKGSIN
jgi:hypothetical protein